MNLKSLTFSALCLHKMDESLRWNWKWNITYLVSLIFARSVSLWLQFSSVQSLSRVRLFTTPWTAARQASLSITNSWSSPKLMSIELVMPSSHLILCHPLLFLPPIPPSIIVFSNGSTFRMRWPKYWSFSFSLSPSNEYSGLISWLGLYTLILCITQHFAYNVIY